MSAHIIALCNQKGGVGKTTTTFHLARAAAAAGQRVLVIDADPQGNLTFAIAATPVADDQVGLADVLSQRSDEALADVLTDALWGVQLVPTSGTTLGLVRDELVVSGAGRENRLRDALAAAKDDYDLVLIDCAPSIDQLMINGLTAADAVLIVSHTKQFSANGLGQLLSTIDEVRKYYNPQLAVAGVIVNQHEEQTVSGRTWAEELQAAAQERQLRILEPFVPKKVVISDAVEASVGLDEYGTREAYRLFETYQDFLTAIKGEQP